MNLLDKIEAAAKFIGVSMAMRRSKNKNLDPRYVIDRIRSPSLEGSPLGSPAERTLRVYMPPGYDGGGTSATGSRYPVVYFLHGYGGGDHQWTFTSRAEPAESMGAILLVVPRKLLKQVDTARAVVFYEQLDALIEAGSLPPFILVQVDGSLHLPRDPPVKNLNGRLAMKGSFYVNSPFSGNYADFVARDVVQHVDARYRTLPRPEQRVIAGVSMGGYGALHLGMEHPDTFGSIVALAPGNLTRATLDAIPLSKVNVEIFGRKMAERTARNNITDILATADMIYARDAPVLPTIERDASGHVTRLDENAFRGWEARDLVRLIDANPGALRGHRVFLYCDGDDEFGLASTTRDIHQALSRAGVAHEYRGDADPSVSLAPHALGSVMQFVAGFQYALGHRAATGDALT